MVLLMYCISNSGTCCWNLRALENIMQIPLTSWAAEPMRRDRRWWQIQWWKRVEKRRGLFVQCVLPKQLFSAFSRRRESWELLHYCINATEQFMHCFSSTNVNVSDISWCSVSTNVSDMRKAPVSQQGKKIKMLFFITKRPKLEKSQVFTSLLYLFFGVIEIHLSWQRRIRWLGSQRASKPLQPFWQRVIAWAFSQSPLESTL